VGAVDGRARYLSATNTIAKTALDPYATYRSLYQQNRAAAVVAARKDLPRTLPDWYDTDQP
jgi:phospholipid-binding lipoprotein MlaA